MAIRDFYYLRIQISVFALQNIFEGGHFVVQQFELGLDLLFELVRLFLMELGCLQEFKQLPASLRETCLFVLQHLQGLVQIQMRVFEAEFDGRSGVSEVVDDHAEESLVALDLGLELVDLRVAVVTEFLYLFTVDMLECQIVSDRK